MYHNYNVLGKSHPSEDRGQYRQQRHLSFLHIDSVVKGTGQTHVCSLIPTQILPLSLPNLR